MPGVRRLSDNDISASNGKHRKDFTKVMRLVDARAVDVVLVWALDRFVRRIADLEDVITRFEAAGCKLATVDGDMDLSSDTGRLVGRILAAVARGEVERKGARQRLAASEAAASERQAVDRLPAAVRVRRRPRDPGPGRGRRESRGAGRGAARRVDRLGRHAGVERPGARFPAGRARQFTRQCVTTILRNPRLAGLNAYHGEITGPGDWRPVLAEADLAGGPGAARRPGPRARRAGCGRCSAGWRPAGAATP